LHRKENSVRRQIRFHSVVGASLHQRNLHVKGGAVSWPFFHF
jgi:hypothetical protein